MVERGDVVVFTYDNRYGWFVVDAFSRPNYLDSPRPHEIRLIRRDRQSRKYLYICMGTSHLLKVVGKAQAQSEFEDNHIQIEKKFLHWTGESFMKKSKEERVRHEMLEEASKKGIE